MMRRGVIGSLLIVVFLYASSSHSQSNTDLGELFNKEEVFIPMRDGVRLHTILFVPKNAQQPLPILLQRTPYGIRQGFPGEYFSESYADLIADGYIFVLQDIRGRFESEGQFLLLSPPRHRQDPKAVDESTDAYDTIDWLVKHTPNNNGRVGVFGVSYDGWLTVMAMIDPHPALKAVSEQASPADEYLGDDFHHNGAFRLSYGFEYSAMMETSKDADYFFKFGRYDTFEWYLELGPLSNVDRNYFHETHPTWNDFVAHPDYDDYWKVRAVPPYLDNVRVPDLNVAGWWDQDDFYGPVQIYRTLAKNNADQSNYLVVGPWNHGEWSQGTGRTLGAIDFQSDTAKYFREKVQAPWFAYWLKDKGAPPASHVLAFQTGSNKWKEYSDWPPRSNDSGRKLYFRKDGRLSFAAPTEGGENDFDSYVSDPAKPVPYRPRPILNMWPGPSWPNWQVEDQRFVHQRPDVLSWETEPLTADVTVAGDIVTQLFASTSGTDSDWIVKLIDVYPDDYPKEPAMGGFQLMVANEVVRARYRRHFDKPEPVVANQVTAYEIDLRTHDHCFQKGHRVMVQVQSTLFPIIDRNPQKFVESIFKARAADYQKATQRVYHSARYPSHIELPAE